jgi:hypothetical protein
MRGLRSGIGSGQLVLVVFVALTAGCQPADERPGLWLSGEVEVGPVGDWSFTNEIEEIFVETRTWYGVPHSVTIWGAAQGGHFYLPSLYYGAAEFPNARYWNRNVVRDPHVRVKLGDRVFEGTAELVVDESEWNRADAAFGKKYPAYEEYQREPGAKWIFLRFEPDPAG